MTNLTITELHKLYASGEASPSEVCRAALDRIERDNDRLNAYITINRESALRQAAVMDADIQEAIRRKPLAGVPVAVKDNMLIAGVRASWAITSRLTRRRPSRSSKTPGQSSSAKPTLTNLRWAVRPRIRRSAPCAIPSTRSLCRVEAREVRRSRSRRGIRLSR